MASTAGLAQVPTSAIRALVGEGLAQFEVYLSKPSDNTPVLYRKAGSSISLPDFDRMADNGVHYLYVGGVEGTSIFHFLVGFFGYVQQGFGDFHQFSRLNQGIICCNRRNSA